MERFAFWRRSKSTSATVDEWYLGADSIVPLPYPPLELPPLDQLQVEAAVLSQQLAEYRVNGCRAQSVQETVAKIAELSARL